MEHYIAQILPPSLAYSIASIGPLSDRMDTIVLALLMVGIVGFVTGPLSGNANPYFWNFLDRLVGVTARRGYVKDKSFSALSFRGTLFSIVYILIAAGLGMLFLVLSHHLSWGGLFEPTVLALLCTSGAVLQAVYRLYLALNRTNSTGDEKRGSFAAVAISMRVDLNTVDDYGIARIGAGFIPVAFDRGLVLPIFFYLLGGLPLAFVVTGVTAAKWALAKNGFAKGYGAFILGVEAAIGFVPRIIASIILVMAALFTPHASVFRALRGLFAFARAGGGGAARASEGGTPLTVMAYALNVSLGGPVQDVDGSPLQQKFVGPRDASARIDSGVLKQSCYMGAMAQLLFLVSMLLILLLVRAAAAAVAVAPFAPGVPTVPLM